MKKVIVTVLFLLVGMVYVAGDLSYAAGINANNLSQQDQKLLKENLAKGKTVQQGADACKQAGFPTIKDCIESGKTKAQARLGSGSKCGDCGICPPAGPCRDPITGVYGPLKVFCWPCL